MNRLQKKLSGLAIAVLAATPLLAWAQAIDIPDVGLPGDPNDDAKILLMFIITNLLLPFAGFIALLFIIIGGFQYMFAGADEGLAKKGKSTLTNAIIGLVIVILSYVIVTVVTNTFTSAFE